MCKSCVEKAWQKLRLQSPWTSKYRKVMRPYAGLAASRTAPVWPITHSRFFTLVSELMLARKPESSHGLDLISQSYSDFLATPHHAPLWAESKDHITNLNDRKIASLHGRRSFIKLTRCKIPTRSRLCPDREAYVHRLPELPEFLSKVRLPWPALPSPPQQTQQLLWQKKPKISPTFTS